MNRVICRIDHEDLIRWRSAVVNKELLEAENLVISQADAQQYLFTYYKVLGEIANKYDIDSSLAVLISAATGDCVEIDNV